MIRYSSGELLVYFYVALFTPLLVFLFVPRCAWRAFSRATVGASIAEAAALLLSGAEPSGLCVLILLLADPSASLNFSVDLGFFCAAFVALRQFSFGADETVICLPA